MTTPPISPAPISLYSGLVVREPIVTTLAPEFERESGTRVETVFEPTTVLLERIAAGERPDLFLGVAAAVRELGERGVLDPLTVTEIAVSAVGFARMPQDPGPIDDSVRAFLDYVLGAPAVAYSLSGASGLHFADTMRALDLLERIDQSAVRFATGLTAEAVVDGRAQVAIQQISELRSVPGDHVVEPIPHELQSYARFAVGVRPGASESARRFADQLSGDRAAEAYAAVGLSAPRPQAVRG
ncbi:substrate-binding domain-containing protein [Microbacterium alcoholitolerans]|uniref:substrate-binding domain-containing protein n=1 Tax=unclassified Microbacterium TaxID=2609290 RepID=UPI003D174B19